MLSANTISLVTTQLENCNGLSAPRLSLSPSSFQATAMLLEELKKSSLFLTPSSHSFASATPPPSSVVLTESRPTKITGVGQLLTRLRNPVNKPRTVIDSDLLLSTSQNGDLPNGSVNGTVRKRPTVVVTNWATAGPIVPRHDHLGPNDIPAPPAHPTDPKEIRRLIRAKMLRCRLCRNRFVERNLYERHLRDRHPEEYTVYMIQQEEEIERQRQEEMESNRLEELACGGFIPPASEVLAENFEVVPAEIPLPGELSGGIPARFDRYGMLRQPKRPFRKKVSPQCAFCDKRFRNECSLRKHIVKKHPEYIDFMQCNHCFKSVKDEKEMASHTCDLTFVCFECVPMRNMCTEQRLFAHRCKFHRGVNSGFKCEECNLKFLTPRKLRKHKKMSHVFTKTYSCHFCEELFTAESAVVAHERIHTGIIKFECKICDYKCNRYVRMEEHKNEEHGYICSICQKRLSEWVEIKNHTLCEHGGYLTSERNVSYIESPRVWIMFKGE